MITRRDILGGTLVLATLAISPAQAQDKPAEIRIGTQKGGFISAVRQRHAVEDAFKPLGIEIKWIDFQFGPPLLEAINVGSVDFGYVGDSPPIFAQAGDARIPRPSSRKEIRRRSLSRRIRRSRRSPISRASASPSAKDRARTICSSPRWRRPACPGAISRRRRSRRLMPPRRS
jgi:hypothetical protein